MWLRTFETTLSNRFLWALLLQTCCNINGGYSRYFVHEKDISVPMMIVTSHKSWRFRYLYYLSIYFRPSQSFRHCTTTADRLAKTNYNSWISSGIISHPRVTLLVPNIQECLPESWKVCVHKVKRNIQQLHRVVILEGGLEYSNAYCGNSNHTGIITLTLQTF